MDVYIEESTLSTVEQYYTYEGRNFLNGLEKLSIRQIYDHKETKKPTRYLSLFNLAYTEQDVEGVVQYLIENPEELPRNKIFLALLHNSKLLKEMLDVNGIEEIIKVGTDLDQIETVHAYKEHLSSWTRPYTEREEEMVKFIETYQHNNIFELLYYYIILHSGRYESLDHAYVLEKLERYNLLDYFKFYYVYVLKYHPEEIPVWFKGVEEDRVRLKYDDYVVDTINLFGRKLLKHPPDLAMYEGVEVVYKPEFISEDIDYLIYLKDVVIMGDNFLNYAFSGSIDLNFFLNLRIIGDNFLYDNPDLLSVDMSSLSNIISIGTNFLSGCQSLTSLNLNLSNVTSIGANFLSDCRSLTSLSLDLPNVTSIRDNFLSRCRSLTSLNLNLPNVTSIGDSFLYYCVSLTSLSLDLPNVTSIGDSFLNTCVKLTSLSLNLPKVTSIGKYFLYYCKSLSSLDLQSLVNVNRVGDNFLDQTKLVSILPPHSGKIKDILSDKK